MSQKRRSAAVQLRVYEILLPIVAVLLAFAIGAVVLWLLGVNPFEAYWILISGAFGNVSGITSTLANEFGEASPGLYTASLVELGLILFLITQIVLVLSRLLLLRLAKQEGKKS